MKKIGKFHVITDTVLQKSFSHLECAKLAVSGGADAIQFRQKAGSAREMIREAAEMRKFCRGAGAVFIVNDRIDVAIASEADGVHLGQDDFPIPLARKLLGPNAIIGGSAGNMEEARRCLEEGADYVGVGPVYTTTSKEDAGPAGGLGLLEEIVKSIPLPVIAIGGITPENVLSILKTGAFGIAVISAVVCRKDPAAAAASLKRVVEDYGRG
ncbi:MAG TPA: thiamine phosphate synthase [Thermodesulfobacteriota bacterium]|nr:thiamine phosphate synthase [Thermodesulfobacteriota bacterium]